MKNNLSLALLLSLCSFSQNPKAATLDKYPTFQKGASYVSWWFDQYGYAESKVALQELRQTNTESISLLTTYYMPTKNSTSISSNSQKTPTDASLRTAISNARTYGMDVMLKPHVDILDGSLRGDISFQTEQDWQAWFNSYKNFINQYADFAKTNNIKLLCVGTELKGTSHRTSDWQSVIQGVRQRFSEKIVYASNWDEVDKISWFDKLDYIGVDAYFPLTNKNNPTIDELVTAWQPHISKIEQVYNKFKKPILLTEIGYRSRDGTNIQPWKEAIDLNEQADCYEAAFRVLWHKPWFYGMYFWNWTTDPNQGGTSDLDFTPHGKPAETIIKNWYANQRTTNAKGWDLYE